MKKNNKHFRKRGYRKKINRINFIILLSIFIIMGIVFGVMIECVFSFLDNSNDKTKNYRTDVAGKEEQQNSTDGEEISSASIELYGEPVLQLKLGEQFIEPGYAAKDQDGTDLTSQVQVDTSSLNRAGTQKVVYTVQGTNGVETQISREVEIMPNTDYETSGLPICMYHYVYDPAAPPEDLNSNYISTDALAEEMKYLHDNGYYFPTWQEVRDYVDGKLLLPEKSIVLTFDDGPNYMYLGTPILEQYQTPATSFVIASYWNSKEMLYGYSSDYLLFESHSYKMHQGGGSIGHGGIYTALSKEEVLEDLQKSFDICGNHDAFAYPFGDYTEEGCSTLEEAGLLCAVTTENAKCFPGDNPYILPRVRMLGTQTLAQFITAIE